MVWAVSLGLRSLEGFVRETVTMFCIEAPVPNFLAQAVDLELFRVVRDASPILLRVGFLPLTFPRVVLVLRETHRTDFDVMSSGMSAQAVFRQDRRQRYQAYKGPKGSVDAVEMEVWQAEHRDFSRDRSLRRGLAYRVMHVCCGQKQIAGFGHGVCRPRGRAFAFPFLLC